MHSRSEMLTVNLQRQAEIRHVQNCPCKCNGSYMKFEFLQNPYKARASTSHHPGETCKNINMDDINSRIIFLLNRFGYLNQLIASAICNSGKVKHNRAFSPLYKWKMGEPLQKKHGNPVLSAHTVTIYPLVLKWTNKKFQATTDDHICSSSNIAQFPLLDVSHNQSQALHILTTD